MKDNKIIIVEGPQGTGKTTLTNYLRDNLPSANLYRLQGQKDKSITGKENSIKMYEALLNYLKEMETVPMDMIFDRTFFSEEVYARLGYKEYSFTDEYKKLLYQLNNLKYNIFYISLYLNNTELFKERLDRESHHNYQSFSVENSINQQNMYKQIANEVSEYKNINIIDLPMDNFDESYVKIKTLFNLK